MFRVDYGHEEVKGSFSKQIQIKSSFVRCEKNNLNFSFTVKFGKDPRQYSTTTKEFVDDGKGNIKGVNTIQVEWTQSPTGQWSMKEVPGTEKYYPADLILLAMGFLGPEKTVPNQLNLELDGRGNVKAVNGQYGTSRDGIFAAGGLFALFYVTYVQ